MRSPSRHSVSVNGPEPAVFRERKSRAHGSASGASASTASGFTIAAPGWARVDRNGANGSDRWNRTTVSDTASTSARVGNTSLGPAATPSSRSNEYLTAAASTGVPSGKTASSRRVDVDSASSSGTSYDSASDRTMSVV